MKKSASIEWLTPAKPATLESLENSNLASVRLRTALGYRVAENAGLACTISDGDNKPIADLIVVGKIDAVTDPKRGERWLRYIQAARQSGSKIIIDYTDHHLSGRSAASDFYMNALPLADQIICSSEKLKENISALASCPISVVDDPFEVPIQEPKPLAPGKKTILWFGHASNLDVLVQCLLSMFDHEDHARLIILTNAYPFPDSYAAQLNVPHLQNIEINVVPWSSESLVQAASISDYCIIPADPENPRKNGASANRLLTAIALGLPTLATPIKSYLPFQRFFHVLGKDAVKSALLASDYDTESIKAGQKEIEVTHSMLAIGNAWKKTLNNLWGAGESHFSTNSCPATLATNSDIDSSSTSMNRSRNIGEEQSLPVRLNLGCGDKIIEGYINVDVVEARAGKRPDVICDLHDLSIFESDFADEILAVHVVEHFWQWEIVDILKEWTRVLKPGGKMILECPNLISAAQEFLKNPDQAAIGGQEGQRSMWVFYGDPGWRDPLMIHRWGYTPKSLATVMHAAGLTEFRQEPAQFKLREPRDMRITGIKPKQAA